METRGPRGHPYKLEHVIVHIRASVSLPLKQEQGDITPSIPIKIKSENIYKKRMGSLMVKNTDLAIGIRLESLICQ